MNQEKNRLSNKKWIHLRIDDLKKRNLLNEPMLRNLCNHDYCQENFNHQFQSILKEVECDNYNNIIKLFDGAGRYYPEFIKLNNKLYWVNSQWYDNTTNSTFHNRDEFEKFYQELIINK
jgi:hypothetical protein